MHPILFRIPGFGLPIYSYGVMLVIGFLLCLELAKALAKRVGLNPELFVNAGMIALTVTATWWTYHFLASRNALDTISAELMATVLASFMYFLGNSISVSLIVSLSQRIPMFHTWSHHFLYSAPSFLIAGLLSLGVLGLTTTHFVLIGFMLVAVVSVAYFCSVRRVAATQ